jgi:hypothetical protein
MHTLNKPRSSLRFRSLLAASIVLTSICAIPASAATQQELEAKLQALADEVDALRSELKQVKADQQVTATTPVSTLTPDVASNAGSSRGFAASNEGLSFFGYGEVDYARPSDDPSDTTATVSRFVVGMNNQFDERTRLVSELEIENTISSAEDPGEVEVEQVYVEREFNDRTFGKVGLFLIPSGLLNENHEPTAFYGVFRNRIETAIIPTTWREGGFLVQGNTETGLRWDVGLTTGFDLSKWDPASAEGRESPLGSIHQELALAKASDVSGVVAVNYTGVPGLRLGASFFGGDASQGQPGFHDNTVTLWEAHGTWTPGKLELAALYAAGHISNTKDINLTFVGNPTLIPEDFYGWYVQAAYHLFDWEGGSLRPFTRFERLNTASNYANLAPGLTPQDGPDQDIITTGLNFQFAQGVVLKADYQHFHGFGASDQINFGLGYQF